MKTATKVFLIISIVLYSSSILSNIIVFLEYFRLHMLFWLLYAIVGIIVCSIGLRKLENYKFKKDLTAIGIVLLFFSLIAGILMLVMEDNAIVENTSHPYYDNNSNTTSNLEKELKKLSDLRDRGIISNEEYENSRKKVIEKLL